MLGNNPGNNEDFYSLSFRRSIAIHLEEGYTTLKVQGSPILKVDSDDKEAIFSAIRLLNGVLGANLSRAEIEEVRDILQEVVGS
jgi:hypothetical protein